jgi:glycosyltransferase involved in cell wall biosynthesis
VKILHVFKDYFPVIGGIENHIKIIAESQASRGFDVTVLTTSRDSRTTVESMNLVRVIKASRVASLSSTPISFSLLKWIRRLDVDITHLHFPYPIGEVAHLFLGRSLKTIITYHNDIVKQQVLLAAYKPFLIQAFKKADCILTTSPQMIRTSPVLRRFSDKTRVVPYGIDLGRFGKPDKGTSSNIRARFKGSRIVLFVGRLRYFKGVQYLIEAMKTVNATLLIIGTGSEEGVLKEKVAEANLGHKVIFLGELPNDNLPEYLDACDVFVLPSSHRSESFGIVQIEAMASGKSVISTELGTGTSFVNVHGKTGLVVPPREPGLLAQAINRLLDDDSLREEFEKNAKARSGEFSREILNERLVEIYKEVLAA